MDDLGPMALPEFISIEVDEDTTAAPSCFDGIRIDKVHNPKNKQFVKSAVDNIRKTLRQKDKREELNRQRRQTERGDIVNNSLPSRSSAPPRVRSGHGHCRPNHSPPSSSPSGSSNPTPIEPALPTNTAPNMASQSISAARCRVASAEQSVASASQALKAVDSQVRMAEEALASIKAQQESAKSRVTSSEKEHREAKENLKHVEERFQRIHVDLDSGAPERGGENGGDPGDKVSKKRVCDDVDGVVKSHGRKSRRVGNNKENKEQNRSPRDNGRRDGVEEKKQGGVCNRDINSDSYGLFQLIQMKPARMLMQEHEPEPNVKSGVWISTHKGVNAADKDRKKWTRSKYGRKSKQCEEGCDDLWLALA